jgi:hypothetical protein
MRSRWRATNPGASRRRGHGPAALDRWQVFPGEVVRDDLGLLADHTLGAAIAPLGEQPAELVDDLVGVEPDAQCIVPHIAAREDALRPS